MKILVKLLKILPIFLFAVLTTGCAAENNKKQFASNAAESKQVVVLHFPSSVVNQNISIQLYRFAVKGKEGKGMEKTHKTIISRAKNGKATIEIVPASYDIFIKTSGKIYGLLGVNISKKSKNIWFREKDVL